MQAVGINFFAVRPTAAPLAGGGAGCDHVMGKWGVYYPAAGLDPAACFKQVGAGLDTQQACSRAPGVAPGGCRAGDAVWGEEVEVQGRCGR